MQIGVAFGTRPEWIKVQPIVEALGDRAIVICTGQHDTLLSEAHWDIHFSLGESGALNRLDEILSSCMRSFPEVHMDALVVQGDTASVLGCALAVFHRGIEVVHLEAGLRSYDLLNPFPEEGYRQMVSRIAAINLAPTVLSGERLVEERVPGEIHVVGNTVLDSLVPRIEDERSFTTVLITLHRRENQGRLNEWCRELDRCAKERPDLRFIFPAHPSPRVQEAVSLLSRVEVIDPVGREALIDLILSSAIIITDSGGIQEEVAFFSKKAIVCRKTTERPEGIDTGHTVLCGEPKYLFELFLRELQNPIVEAPCPYGDGTSAERVVGILEARYQ